MKPALLTVLLLISNGLLAQTPGAASSNPRKAPTRTDRAKFMICTATAEADGSITVTIIPPGRSESGCMNAVGNETLDFHPSAGTSTRVAGIFTNTQMNESMQAIVHACDVTTEFQSVQGQNTATDALSACLTVPASSTVWQPNAVAGYVNSSSKKSHSVGGYFQARALDDGAEVWGANSVAQVGSGIRNAKLTGLEVDVNQSSGVDNTYGGALDQDGVDIISAGTNHPRNGLGITAVNDGNLWEEAALFGNYQVVGLQVSNGAIGSIAHYIIPPDDTPAREILGRNHANTSDAWSITNGGSGTFRTVQSIFVSPSLNSASSGVVRLAAGDAIRWRSSGDDADLSLTKDSSNRLLWNGNQSTVASASFTTTSAASDEVSVQGLTASGHCSISPTNLEAAKDLPRTYISAKTANRVTIKHPGLPGRTWDVLCTPN